MDFSKLLFLPIDIPNPPAEIAEKLDRIDYSEMITDNYRNCYHIPMMTKDKKWTYIAKNIPELINWCESYVFSWAKPSRIMIITTPSGKTNPPHIDCSPDKFVTWQHKLRYVIRGNTDSLYYISKQGDKYVPEIDKPFIMDGKWPHVMHNTHSETKYTFALGAPWEPDDSDIDYIKMLEKSYKKYKDHYLSSEKLQLPENYESLFKKEYLKNA